MATIEQVEKLREKANVSYAEAKEALEKCNDDMLDAILYLEEQGRIKTPETGGKYTAAPDKKAQRDEKRNKRADRHEYHRDYDGKEDFHGLWSKFWAWCKKIFKKGCENTFEVYRYGEQVFKMPVIVFVMLLIWAFWITIPLMIVGLFFGFKYLFGGPDLATMDINKAMHAAADAAQNAKEEFRTASENHQKNMNEDEEQK